MQYTPICQGISFEQGFPSNSPNGTVPVAGGPLRYGIFSRSLTSCAEVAKPMGWTIHSTVPFPMLEHRETVHQLSRFGVGPEIYFSGSPLDRLTPEAAGAVAESLRSAGIPTTTFHAPFNDISPGARDEEVRRVTVRRLRQAVSLAPLFRPLGVVMHGGYSDWLLDFDEVPDHLLCLRAAVGSKRLGFCDRLGEPFQGSV